MPPTVAVFVADLMFQPRIADAVRALGYDARAADTPESAASALADRPALAVIDLHGPFDVERLIGEAKAAGARVLAFGRHTEPELLRAARKAGADTVVPRSQLVEELQDLLRSLLPAPTPNDDQTPAGGRSSDSL